MCGIQNGVYVINPILDPVDRLSIIDRNGQGLTQTLRLKLCLSEGWADAAVKSFTTEERARGEFPRKISFHTKITKHVMTSARVTAGWQTQGVGKTTPKKPELMVHLAQVFETSLFRFSKATEKCCRLPWVVPTWNNAAAC